MAAFLYIALYSILFIGLSLYVVQGRHLYRIVIGDGNDTRQLRRMRAQANFAEYTPIFLLELIASESMGLSVYVVHFFGLIFLIGRIVHAYGILKAEQVQDGKVYGIKFRFMGMAITFTSIGCLALYLLFKYLFLYSYSLH